MKKILLACLAVTCLLAVCSCQKTNDAPPSDASNATPNGGEIEKSLNFHRRGLNRLSRLKKVDQRTIAHFGFAFLNSSTFAFVASSEAPTAAPLT